MISTDSTIYVIDGERKIRQSVSGLVEEMGLHCRAHASAADFLDEYSPAASGCIVLELVLPDISGLHLQNQLWAKAQPAMPAIFLTAHASVRAAVHAMRDGALHFMEKPISPDELREAIYEAVLVDQDRRQARRLQQQVRARLGRLTIKEEHVLGLMGRGMSSREIAEQLEVSIRTVELRRSKVMKKLGVDSLTNLERLARQVGSIDGNGDRRLMAERPQLGVEASGFNSASSIRV